MRNVSYEFNPMQVLASLVNSFVSENGFWRLELSTETMSGNFANTNEGQRPGVMPGQVVRILGARVVQAPGPGDLTVERRNSEVLYANDRDQCGPEESSGSAGEDSGVPRESYPAPIAAGF